MGRARADEATESTMANEGTWWRAQEGVTGRCWWCCVVVEVSGPRKERQGELGHLPPLASRPTSTPSTPPSLPDKRRHQRPPSSGNGPKRKAVAEVDQNKAFATKRQVESRPVDVRRRRLSFRSRHPSGQLVSNRYTKQGSPTVDVDTLSLRRSARVNFHVLAGHSEAYRPEAATDLGLTLTLTPGVRLSVNKFI